MWRRGRKRRGGLFTLWGRWGVEVCVASVILGSGPVWARSAEDQTRRCQEGAEARKWVRLGTDAAKPYEERVASYKRAIDACPEDASLYGVLAELLLDRYEFQEALRWLEQGLSRAPHDPALNLDRAGAFLLMGQSEEVISSLKNLPPSAKSRFYLGLAYRNLRDRRAAQESLRQAWELGYHDPFLLYALVEQDRILKEDQKLSDDLQTLREQFPNSPWPHMATGDVLKAQQKRAEAEEEYKEAQKLDPNLPFLHHQLGSIAYSRGDYPLAASYFRKEITLNPTYPAPYVFLGICLHRQGKNREALPFLEQGLAHAPEAPLAYLELALAQTDLNQLDQALVTLQTGSKKFPDQPVFHVKLARLLSRLGRTEEAKAQAALAQELGRSHEIKEQQLLGVE